MVEYFVINLIWSAIIACALLLLRSAPSRIKFHLTILALVAWLIPWQAINIPFSLLPSKSIYEYKIHGLSELHQVVESYASYATTPADEQGAQASSLSVSSQTVAPKAISSRADTWANLLAIIKPESLFALATLIGLGLLALGIRQYLRIQKDLFQSSSPAPYLQQYLPKHLQPVSIRKLDKNIPGMASGLFKPTIWIGQGIDDTVQLKTVLLHELTHIKHHDLKWNAFVYAVRHLLWWNPCVGWLAKQALLNIEKSCDEACAEHVGNDAYTRALAEMTLTSFGVTTQHHNVNLAYASKADNESIARLRSLQIQKYLAKTHVTIILAASVVAALLTLELAYDKPYVQLSFFREEAKEQTPTTINDVYSVYEWQQPYYQAVNLIHAKRFAEAKAILDAQTQTLETSGVNERTLKTLHFGAYALLLGDTDQYQDIITLAERLFNRVTILRNKHINRLMAIAYINMNQPEKAVDFLLEVKAQRNAVGPTDVLLSQAYFHSGDYQAAFDAATEGLKRNGDNFHNRFIVDALIKVRAKSAVILGENHIAEKYLTRLGLDSIAAVRDTPLKQQVIPSPYFVYTHINGQAIKGIDDNAFPLPDKIASSSDPVVQSVLLKVRNLRNLLQYEAAAQHIRQALQVEKTLAAKDRVLLLSMLFLLESKMEHLNESKALAAELVGSDGVHPSVLARARYTLSISGRHAIKRDIQHFKDYLDMHTQPNIASDHETIFRFYWVRTDYEAYVEPALQRVDKFYDDTGFVPDLFTANKIMGFARKLGHNQLANKYKALIATHYNRSFNFTLN